MATIDYKIADTLPTNIEAERAILGAILLDNSAFNEAARTSRLATFPSTPTAGSMREW